MSFLSIRTAIKQQLEGHTQWPAGRRQAAAPTQTPVPTKRILGPAAPRLDTCRAVLDLIGSNIQNENMGGFLPFK